MNLAATGAMRGPGAPRWLVAAATVVGNACLVLLTLLFASLAVLTGWIPPRGHAMFLCARMWSWSVLLTSGVWVSRSFEHRLERRGRYVFMSNHESLYDIPALIATLPGQTRFLAKRGLFRIPVFGWALKVGGFVTIDRQNLESARDSFADAVASLREGVSVLVFPEGTRSATGELLPFKRGGFLLALKSGLPIVPVGVDGSRAVRAKGSYTIHPGRVRVTYGSPIETAGLGVSRRGELVETVRAEIRRLSRGADAGATNENPTEPSDSSA